MYIFKEAETWVAIAFILFVIILIRLGWSKIMQALDKRAEEIKKELDEARNLREQAQSILADYQRKKRDSEKEIFNITDKAKSDTEKNIKVALQNHKDLLERRKKTAEQKITQAQERAIQEIKDSIVDLSINATKNIIKDNFDNTINKKMVKEASSKINKGFINI